MKVFLLVLMALFPSYSQAKVMEAGKACLGLTYTPKIILNKLYDINLYKKILKRIEKEVENKVISEELSGMIKHIVRNEEFKSILIREGRIWCNER
jgi:hypothetical protein